MLPNIITSKTFVHKSGAVRSVAWIFITGAPAGLAVIGRIGNIGQNVLQSVFQTGSGRSPRYFQIFSLIAFLEEAFIRNIMIILCINDEKLRRYKSNWLRNATRMNNRMPKIMLSYRPNGRTRLERPLKDTITRGQNRSIKASLVTDDDDDYDDYALIIQL